MASIVRKVARAALPEAAIRALGGRPSPPTPTILGVEVKSQADAVGLDVTVEASTLGHMLVVDTKVGQGETDGIEIALWQPQWSRNASVVDSDTGPLFRTAIPAPALARHFELEVWMARSGEATPLATITGTNSFSLRARRAERPPLLVSGVPRGGTTFMMRLLAEHPDVVCVREYPYESRHAQYFAHWMLVGGGTGDRARSMDANEVADPAIRVGSSPFFRIGAEHSSWLAGRHLEALARSTKSLIDEFYRDAASRQAKRRFRFFAEKFPGMEQRNALRALYPGTREIFLVRDLRDTVCSAVAMNTKRGTEGFGAAHASTMTEHLKLLAIATMAHWARYRHDWSERERIIVRYEDIVLDPISTLRRLCADVGIDQSDDVLRNAVALAGADNELRERHVTSPDVMRSVGRWRSELPADTVALAAELTSEFNETFGYALQ